MSDKSLPIILITNDDGVTAPGIAALVAAVKGLGRIIVVAPDSPRSGMGHAVTIGDPLRLEKIDGFEGIETWQCSGTPVDCVKLAKDKILHRKPDLCLSGINHGANHSINIIYSGTMSAAMEAAIEGIPSAGFSLLDFRFDADFTVAKSVVRSIAERMLQGGLPYPTLLNVNIPKGPAVNFKGMRVCRQAQAKWAEEFEKRTDPLGREYYWMTGRFINLDEGIETDSEALKNGYVSIVPVQLDFTNHQLKTELQTAWRDLLV
jgi:5'-nucleotidase